MRPVALAAQQLLRVPTQSPPPLPAGSVFASMGTTIWARRCDRHRRQCKKRRPRKSDPKKQARRSEAGRPRVISFCSISRVNPRAAGRAPSETIAVQRRRRDGSFIVLRGVFGAGQVSGLQPGVQSRFGCGGSQPGRSSGRTRHRRISARLRETIAANPALLPGQQQSQALLAAYMLEKALYELLYELNNRPSWLRIPLGGHLSLVGQVRLPGQMGDDRRRP